MWLRAGGCPGGAFLKFVCCSCICWYQPQNTFGDAVLLAKQRVLVLGCSSPLPSLGQGTGNMHNFMIIPPITAPACVCVCMCRALVLWRWRFANLTCAAPQKPQAFERARDWNLRSRRAKRGVRMLQRPNKISLCINSCRYQSPSRCLRSCKSTWPGWSSAPFRTVHEEAELLTATGTNTLLRVVDSNLHTPNTRDGRALPGG